MRSGAKSGLLGMVIVFVLCLIALGYLYQHSCSRCLTRREVALRSRHRVLSERVESLEVEVMKLTSFVRLDSVWMAAGQPKPPVWLAEGPALSRSVELAERR